MSIGRVATILRYSSRGKLDVKGKPADITWEQEELKAGTMTSRCYSTTDSVHTQTSLNPTEHSHLKMFYILYALCEGTFNATFGATLLDDKIDCMCSETINYNPEQRNASVSVLFLLDDAGLNKGPPRCTNTGGRCISLTPSFLFFRPVKKPKHVPT